MIYVLSDIHGQMDRFDRMLELIGLREEDTLYILGDVIDRHPDGIRILEKIMAMPNVKMTLGNHEDMMSDALTNLMIQSDPVAALSDEDNDDLLYKFDLWFANGGQVTFNAFKELPPEEQEAVLAYIDSLPLQYNIEVGGTKYILVHAAPVETFRPYLKYDSPRRHALWYRDVDCLPVKLNETVIFGHTRTKNFQDDIPQRIWHGKRFIGIDCGCASSHREDSQLACLRLDDGKEFYIQ